METESSKSTKERMSKSWVCCELCGVHECVVSCLDCGRIIVKLCVSG